MEIEGINIGDSIETIANISAVKVRCSLLESLSDQFKAIESEGIKTAVCCECGNGMVIAIGGMVWSKHYPEIKAAYAEEPDSDDMHRLDVNWRIHVETGEE